MNQIHFILVHETLHTQAKGREYAIVRAPLTLLQRLYWL